MISVCYTSSMYFSENREQIAPPSIERLRQGDGFQEIVRAGWGACRTAILQKTSYSEWIQVYLDQRTPFNTSTELARRALSRA